LLLNLILIGIYFYARRQDNKPLVKIVKPTTVIVSWLIAAGSLLGPNPDLPLVVVILGMAIAIISDLLNIDMSDMAVVLRRLVIAVIAYLTYAIGPTILNGFHAQDWIVALILLCVYALTMRTICPAWMKICAFRF
jgi:hypothetical protein